MNQIPYIGVVDNFYPQELRRKDQSMRIRQLEISMANLLNRHEVDDTWQYGLKLQEHKYTLGKKRITNESTNLDNHLEVCLEMSKPPLNYVHNIIQESVPVIIPFKSECEVVTSHPSANVRCDRNSNMITPTIKSNADSATNESNEWTLVEKKRPRRVIATVDKQSEPIQMRLGRLCVKPCLQKTSTRSTNAA